MLPGEGAVRITKPTVIRNGLQIVLVYTTCIRNPRVQKYNGIFVFRTGCTRTVIPFVGVTNNGGVSGNIDCCACNTPRVCVVVGSELDGLTIPLGVDFQLMTVR